MEEEKSGTRLPEMGYMYEYDTDTGAAGASAAVQLICKGVTALGGWEKRGLELMAIGKSTPTGGQQIYRWVKREFKSIYGNVKGILKVLIVVGKEKWL